MNDGTYPVSLLNIVIPELFNVDIKISALTLKANIAGDVVIVHMILLLITFLANRCNENMVDLIILDVHTKDLVHKLQLFNNNATFEQSKTDHVVNQDTFNDDTDIIYIMFLR